MKKKCFPLILGLFVFSLIFNYAQAQVVIDVSALPAQFNDIDFSDDIKLRFTNNKVNAALEIILDDNGTKTVMKKGIPNTADFTLTLTAEPGGRGLLVPSTGGEPVSLSPVDEIILTYGGKKITLLKKQEDDDNDKKGRSADTENTPSGIELHDAILAKKYYESNDARVFSILAKMKNSTETDPAEIIKLYTGNIFIEKLFEGKLEAFKDRTGIQGGFFGGLAKKAMNADVTSIADGFARFLVKRTKEELNIAFFQHFKDLINKEEYLDAQLLFPATLKTLNAIDQDIYKFENYITTLRESFENDLSTLLDHTPDVIEKGKFKGYFTSHPNIKYSALVCLGMAKDLLNGSHPGQVIEDIKEEYVDGFAEVNVTASIKALQVLSASVRSRGEEKYWSPVDSIKMLLTKEDKNFVAANFYLGFIFEKAEGISFKGNKKLQDYLTTVHANGDMIKEAIAYVKQLLQHAATIETALEKINDKKPDEPTIDVYYRLFNSFADIVEHLNNIGDLSFIKNPIAADVKKYLAVSRQSAEFALNIGHKNYGSAIVNCYNVYIVITEKKYDAAGDEVPNDQLPSVTIDGKTKPGKELVSKTAQFIKKYGNFMSNMVKAKNSDEVAAAIESVALPVGSASIKRHSEWNIALNAYVGLFLGVEKIKNVDEDFKPNTTGITAPIGISISRGINWWNKNGWSTSLFISILDLGAPVAFRFKDDVAESVPSIQLKDIISPGIFASVGFPRFPISCNVGWQSGPLLRKLDPSVASLAGSTYSRWSISFAVDIPLLNFYTKTH